MPTLTLNRAQEPPGYAGIHSLIYLSADLFVRRSGESGAALEGLLHLGGWEWWYVPTGMKLFQHFSSLTFRGTREHQTSAQPLKELNRSSVMFPQRKFRLHWKWVFIYELFKEEKISVLPQLFHLIEKEGILPNSFYDKDITRKENHRPMSLVSTNT